MRYELPVFARHHHDGRWTLRLLIPDEDLAAHGATREEAESALAEAVAARIRDPEDRLGDRLAETRTSETRRVVVPVRVENLSGRRADVKLPVTFAVLARPTGDLEVCIPRLLRWLSVPRGESADDAVRDELRAELAGCDPAALLSLVPDQEERVEQVEVQAPPRRRVLARAPRQKREEPFALGGVGVDLTAAIRSGQPAVAHGRDAEVEALLAAVGADPPASVLLVGPPGVGKSAIVQEAARRIALGEAPPSLRGASVHSLSGNRIVAGMHYLGDWQERCQEIVEQARARQAIVFVDDLAELAEAGRTDDRSPGALRFFAPHVARGELVLVAEATPERLARVERLDGSLASVFTRLEVRELERSDAIAVVGRVLGPLGKKHGVGFGPGIAERAVELGRRFVPARRLPGKAIALATRAAERAREAGRTAVSTDELVASFAQDSGLPEVVLRDELPLERDKLVAELEGRVVEQPEAARALADAVLLLKAGLNDPKKPVAVYLFVGPTGTGKTESARVLAERLFGSADRLVRFDMSEFQGPAGALRLAGGEGVGEGELAKRIRAQPFSVVLLDEIEKAAPSVFDLLLSVLGEGRLVDHGGRVADFRSAIFVLTSNLGAGDPEGVGFEGSGARPDRGAHFRRAVEQFFRPELLNRIDRVVTFGPLSLRTIEEIARRELGATLAREGLERRRVRVRFAPELVPFLARVGYHPRFGARPLKREVERRVLAPLAGRLARHSGRSEVEVELWLDGDEVRLAARDLEAVRTSDMEFADPVAPFASPLLRAGLAAVRARLADLRESWILRAPLDEAARARVVAVDARVRAAGEELATLDGQLASLGRASEGRAELARRLDALDRFATEAELELFAAVRARPLARLTLRESTPAPEPGAAARALAGVYRLWALGRGIGVELEESEGAVALRFDAPERAGLLAVEEGFHELALDVPEIGLRGARVVVGEGAVVVRRYGGPEAFVDDPRSGLRQRVGLEELPARLDRFLLGGWRTRG